MSKLWERCVVLGSWLIATCRSVRSPQLACGFAPTAKSPQSWTVLDYPAVRTKLPGVTQRVDGDDDIRNSHDYDSDMSADAPTRRWFQFRLRTLLVLMVVFGLVMGWVRIERDKIQERNALISSASFQLSDFVPQPHWHTLAFGEDPCGFAKYIDARVRANDTNIKSIEGAHNLHSLDLNGTKQLTSSGLKSLEGLTSLKRISLRGSNNIDDACLRHFRFLSKLEWLCFDWTNVTDDGLVHLNGLKHLKNLYLEGTVVDGHGLRHLSGLPNLALLNLDHTQIADSNLEELRHVPQLQILVLRNNSITDAGLAKIASLKCLTHLYLSETLITDNGLKNLEAMPQLVEIDVSETYVTGHAVVRLRAASPRCNVIWKRSRQAGKQYRFQ